MDAIARRSRAATEAINVQMNVLEGFRGGHSAERSERLIDATRHLAGDTSRPFAGRAAIGRVGFANTTARAIGGANTFGVDGSEAIIGLAIVARLGNRSVEHACDVGHIVVVTATLIRIAVTDIGRQNAALARSHIVVVIQSTVEEKYNPSILDGPSLGRRARSKEHQFRRLHRLSRNSCILPYFDRSDGLSIRVIEPLHVSSRKRRIRSVSEKPRRDKAKC